MTAQDNLSRPQFYHGTHLKMQPGDMVEPGHPSAWPGDDHDRHLHVYMSESPYVAMDFAGKRGGGKGGHVYSVETTGAAEHDPELPPDEWESHKGWRSSHPLKVTGERTFAWGSGAG